MSKDFFEPQDLDFDHVKAIVAGMFAVAKVDGIHDREMAMIREFYEGCARKGDPSLEEVASLPFDVAVARTLFPTPEQAKLFVKSLILLAFADGVYKREEDALIREYAKALGLTDPDVDRLHQATKEFLLASLAHVQNLDALKEVARNLDLS